MGEYDLVLFLTSKKFSVMEVDLNGKSKTIGFHGDEYYQYDKFDDIDEFYKNLTDTYNVDNLSELSTNIFLIDCGIEQKAKWHLINKLNSCESLNINNLSCLLPILLSKKGLLQVGKQVVVEFLDEKYAYICDDEYHVEELTTRGKKAQQTLMKEDFSFIAVWEGNLSQNNNGYIDDKLKEAAAALEIQKNDYENKITELNRTIESLKSECDSIRSKLETLSNIHDQKASNDIINNRRIVKAVFSHFGNIVKEEVENGAIVKANQRIGGLFRNRNKPVIEKELYAPRAGKVAWLLLDGDQPFGEFDDIYQKREMIVAVVGDESDNINDMIEWIKTEEKKQLQKKK